MTGGVSSSCPASCCVWVSGCVVIWSSLFAIGNFLYGRLQAAFMGACIVGGFLLFTMVTGGEAWRHVMSSGVFRLRETVVDRSYLPRRTQEVKIIYYEDAPDATVSSVQSGHIDLVIDQQQWLQGFMGVLQVCLSHNYGFSGLFVNTGGGFVDATNIDVIAPLVEQQIR